MSEERVRYLARKEAQQVLAEYIEDLGRQELQAAEDEVHAHRQVCEDYGFGSGS